MGGTLSRLEENDWNEADGGLRGTSNTIDDSASVSEYAVYFLVKRSLSQREFDVIDGDGDLLYTTRPVPGTIACFDILGRGLNERLLRVSVDIARRYWIIHRFGVPAYDNQAPDREATSQFLAECRSSDDRELLMNEMPLFKRCCITLSWSRYMMVAASYGPPSDNMLFQAAQEVATSTSIDDLEPPNTCFVRCATDDDIVRLDANSGCQILNIPNKDAIEAQVADAVVERHSCGILNSSLHKISADTGFSDAPTSDSVEGGAAVLSSASSSMTNMKEWVVSRSLLFREKLESKKKVQTREDLLEGIVDLSMHITLCQEIYNRVFGNYQTSMISKEKALELLRIDREHHENHHPDETEVDPNNEPLAFVEETVVQPGPGRGAEESKEENLSTGYDSEVENTDGKQAIVGHWRWQHTLRYHRIELHAAKGTDLALHVAMAVIASQVRLERHAISMTI